MEEENRKFSGSTGIFSSLSEPAWVRSTMSAGGPLLYTQPRMTTAREFSEVLRASLGRHIKKSGYSVEEAAEVLGVGKST
ncbi:MAG: hypothetical protein AAGF23_04080, partial [Acidobacteriota bacterium]